MPGPFYGATYRPSPSAGRLHAHSVTPARHPHRHRPAHRDAGVVPGGMTGHLSAAYLPPGYTQFFQRAEGCRRAFVWPAQGMPNTCMFWLPIQNTVLLSTEGSRYWLP